MAFIWLSTSCRQIWTVNSVMSVEMKWYFRQQYNYVLEQDNFLAKLILTVVISWFCRKQINGAVCSHAESVILYVINGDCKSQCGKVDIFYSHPIRLVNTAENCRNFMCQQELSNRVSLFSTFCFSMYIGLLSYNIFTPNSCCLKTFKGLHSASINDAMRV